MIKLKPGFHMIATIAVIAAIAEKKKILQQSQLSYETTLSAIAAITIAGCKALRTHADKRYISVIIIIIIKSSILAIVVAAIAGEWFPILDPPSPVT